MNPWPSTLAGLMRGFDMPAAPLGADFASADGGGGRLRAPVSFLGASAVSAFFLARPSAARPSRRSFSRRPLSSTGARLGQRHHHLRGDGLRRCRERPRPAAPACVRPSTGSRFDRLCIDRLGFGARSGSTISGRIVRSRPGSTASSRQARRVPAIGCSTGSGASRRPDPGSACGDGFPGSSDRFGRFGRHLFGRSEPAARWPAPTTIGASSIVSAGGVVAAGRILRAEDTARA